MKITKEELANIIKEEVEKALEERMSHEEYTDWADKNGIKLKLVQDKDNDNLLMVPVSKPKLPKNWKELEGGSSHPARYWFRMWYKHGKKPALHSTSKAQKDKNELPRGGFDFPPAKKLPSEKGALKALGQTPRKKKKGTGKKMPKTAIDKSLTFANAGEIEKELDGRDGKKKDIDSFRFRPRSKPFDALGARKPRGPQKSSGDAKPVLKGKPILIRNGRRTSLKAKDSQWKFRDGTIIPIYNYIPGRGRVEDEEGLKYYGLSLEEQVADFPSFADWWQGDNRKKYPSASRAKRGYSIARSKAVSQTQKNLQKAADDLKDEK